MTSSSLNSDHVSYLVWRYLQELGYGETAVKLQKEWKQDPQGLPFAQFIKTHALVSLVQKGLQYYEVEQSVDKRGNPIAAGEWTSASFFGPDLGRAAAAAAAAPAAPSRSSPNAAPDVDVAAHLAPALPPPPEPVAAGGGRAPSPRKHARDSGPGTDMNLDSPPQPPERKKSRRSNGVEQGTTGDAMEVDSPTPQQQQHQQLHQQQQQQQQNGFGNYPHPSSTPRESSAAADAAASDGQWATATATATRIVTNGTSQGVQVDMQVDRVAELGAETTSLLDTSIGAPGPIANHDLSVKVNGAPTSQLPGAATGGNHAGGSSRSVMHARWNPRHPKILATAGTDALCRLWNFEGATLNVAAGNDTTSYQNGSSKASPIQFMDLDLDGTKQLYITAIAWDPEGNVLAVAPRSPREDVDSEVILFNLSGRFLESFPVGRDSLISLCWNSAGSMLLGVSGNLTNEESELFVWTTTGMRPRSIPVPGVANDACWLGEDSFALCCGTQIRLFRIVHNQVSPIGSTSRTDLFGAPTEGHELNFIRYDPIFGNYCTAASDGTVDVYTSQTHAHLHTHPHPAALTSINWQPLTPRSSHLLQPRSARFIGTTCTDGSVRLLNGNSPFHTIHVLIPSPPSPSLSPPDKPPALGLAFSPNGAEVAVLLAGGAVWFFDALNGGLPKAVWRGRDIALKGLVDDSMGLELKEREKDEGVGSEIADEDEGDGEAGIGWDGDGKRLVVVTGGRVCVVDLGGGGNGRDLAAWRGRKVEGTTA